MNSAQQNCCSRMRIDRVWVFVAACIGPVCGSAVAADRSDKPSELVFFLALVVVILVGRLLGELMQRIGQPAVMGQLLGGLMLGPSVFGALAPDWQHALFASSAHDLGGAAAIGGGENYVSTPHVLLRRATVRDDRLKPMAVRLRDVDDSSCSHAESLNCFGRFGNRLNESYH